MKLSSFKFQDGKVLWLPEYPEEPGYPCLDCTKMDCDAAKCTEKHEEAVAQSLASAIEVAPEDIIIIKRLIVESVYKNGQVGNATKVITSMWQPEKDKVYSAECEMEKVEKCSLSKPFAEPKCDCDDLCTRPNKVARLKPAKEENSAHSYTEGMEVDAVLKPEDKEEKEVELREFIKNRFRQIEVILSGPGSAEWYPFDGFDREGVIAMKRAYQDIFRQLTPSSLKQ